MPSTSKKQARFMQAIAHSPSFAKKVGVKQSVGKDFAAADKGKTFAKGGTARAEINKQDTKHGKMDMPFSNLNRYAGLNKGGMMGKVKRYNGDTDDGSEVYSDRDENPEAQEVERKTFAGGVRMSPDYLTKSTPAAPRRISPTESRTIADETARNEATIMNEEVTAKDKANMASNTAGNRASSAYQKARATNEQQASRARSFDNNKDYSGNGLRTAGNVAGAIGGGAAATAALLAGQPLAARMIASRTAVPAAKEVLGSVFRSNRTTGVEKAGEGAARAVAKEAARRESTPNTTAPAVKPGGRVREDTRMGPPAPNKTASAIKPGGKIRDTKGPTAAEMEKLVNEGKVALKKGGAVMKESNGMMKKEVAFMQKKGAPKSMIKHEKAEMGMGKGGMPMKDGKPAFMKKFAKGGGIESRGKTKGTVIRMASGGSVSSASRRADGIAQRGKTRC